MILTDAISICSAIPETGHVLSFTWMDDTSQGLRNRSCCSGLFPLWRRKKVTCMVSPHIAELRTTSRWMTAQLPCNSFENITNNSIPSPNITAWRRFIAMSQLTQNLRSFSSFLDGNVQTKSRFAITSTPNSESKWKAAEPFQPGKMRRKPSWDWSISSLTKAVAPTFSKPVPPQPRTIPLGYLQGSLRRCVMLYAMNHAPVQLATLQSKKGYCHTKPAQVECQGFMMQFGSDWFCKYLSQICISSWGRHATRLAAAKMEQKLLPCLPPGQAWKNASNEDRSSSMSSFGLERLIVPRGNEENCAWDQTWVSQITSFSQCLGGPSCTTWWNCFHSSTIYCRRILGMATRKKKAIKNQKPKPSKKACQEAPDSAPTPAEFAITSFPPTRFFG